MFKEVKIFFTALIFLTIIPVSKWAGLTEVDFNKSAKYFSLVGLIIGTVGAGVYYLSSLLLPDNISILLSIVATVLITAGFHEDGLADTFDAFGGGSTKERVLEIMKDSRTGSFGVLSLIFVLLLKFLTLNELTVTGMVFIIIIAGHSISRFAAVTPMFTHNYVRSEDSTSKTKSVAQKLTIVDLIILTFFGILPLFFMGLPYLILIIPVLLTREVMIQYFNKRIGGYTGDCCGAIQQVSEVVFYLSMLVVLWNYI